MGGSTVGIQVIEMPQKLVGKLAGMIARSVEGAGVVVSGINVAIFSNTIDAMELFKKIQANAGGKGGGSAKAANGKLEKAATVDEITKALAV